MGPDWDAILKRITDHEMMGVPTYLTLTCAGETLSGAQFMGAGMGILVVQHAAQTRELAMAEISECEVVEGRD